MKTVFTLLATFAIVMPAFCAEEGGPPPGFTSVIEVKINGQSQDLSSPEEQERIAAEMQKHFNDPSVAGRPNAELMSKGIAPMFERMAQANRGPNLDEVKKAIGMSDEEFDAIKPLLENVKQLRMQRARIDNTRRWSQPESQPSTPSLLPPVEKIRDAKMTLQALLDDAQANTTEIASAIARVRKAHEEFESILAKAREDLRAVLNPRQEAVLIQNGMLN